MKPTKCIKRLYTLHYLYVYTGKYNTIIWACIQYTRDCVDNTHFLIIDYTNLRSQNCTSFSFFCTYIIYLVQKMLFYPTTKIFWFKFLNFLTRIDRIDYPKHQNFQTLKSFTHIFWLCHPKYWLKCNMPLCRLIFFRNLGAFHMIKAVIYVSFETLQPGAACRVIEFSKFILKTTVYSFIESFIIKDCNSEIRRMSQKTVSCRKLFQRNWYIDEVLCTKVARNWQKSSV